MLSAVTHSHRDLIDLAGMWDFRADPQKVGEAAKWYQKGSGDWDILYVPANWNEQRAAYDEYMGWGWYRRRVFVPASWRGRQVKFVIQGALHTAKAWVNGQLVGEHDGGFTPLEADVSAALCYGEDNILTICVDDTLSMETVPQGTTQNRTYIDWYNWGGPYRPLYLEATDPTHLEDLTLRTLCALPEQAVLDIHGQVKDPAVGTTEVELALYDPAGKLVVKANQAVDEKGEFSTRWTIPQPALWSPDSPNLYHLHVQVRRGDTIVDHVEFNCGLRTIELRNGKLYMNGQLFFQKGISRVEDAAMQGRASWGPVVRRDYDLLKTCGANIYRPAGYCPSIPDVLLADRLGVCVIVDIPCFGKRDPEMFDNPKVLSKAQRWLIEAVAVYKNHPSVVLWDLATEPVTTTAPGRHYIQTLYDTARRLDPTRPVFYIWHCLHYKEDKAQDIVDLLCLWIGVPIHQMHEDWDEGIRLVDEAVEYMHRRYPDKPVLLYFGAPAVSGVHSDPARWYSEEFQAKHLEWAWQYTQSKPYVIGFWCWCLCDYRSRPAAHVGGLLRWGIYDRERQPKLGAHILRELYPTRPTLTSEEC